MNLSFFLLLLVLFPKPQSDGSLDEAIRLYGKGDFKQAANLLKQITTAAPNGAEARIWLGKSYLKIRKWDDAVQEMEKAIQLQPSNAQYHLWLGRACGARASHSFFATALGWARRVVKEFEKARELAPDDLEGTKQKPRRESFPNSIRQKDTLRAQLSFKRTRNGTWPGGS
jgi:tetratricopeptide (TPR) repeat protein